MTLQDLFASRLEALEPQIRSALFDEDGCDEGQAIEAAALLSIAVERFELGYSNRAHETLDEVDQLLNTSSYPGAAR